MVESGAKFDVSKSEVGGTLVAHSIVPELEPFYFGDPDGLLYGCCHAASGGQRNVAVVLCPPLGDEAIRIHRAYKQIALRLSRAGFPVLRFDYYGWGDSAGQDTDATLSRWKTDIGTAIEEVKGRSGAARVVLIGLRLGATLALQTVSRRDDVAGIVLWEPVAKGTDYLAEVEEAHRSKLDYFQSDPVYTSGLPEGMTEILGFVLSAAMRQQIEELNVFDVAFSTKAFPVLIVERTTTESVSQLNDYLLSQSFQVNYQCLDDPAIWGEDPDKALIPAQTLKAITSWFNEKFT